MHSTHHARRHAAWARDEPPSPKDEAPPPSTKERHSDARTSDNRPSDVASYQSSYVEESEAGPSRWWAFTRHRPGELLSQPLALNRTRSTRDRSLSVAWLTSTIARRSADHADEPKSPTIADLQRVESPVQARAADGLHLDLPPQIVQSPNTLSQTRTPGWETPWSPRLPERTANWDGDFEIELEDRDDNEKLSRWQRRKKRIRVYMLTNTYVPLVSIGRMDRKLCSTDPFCNTPSCFEL